MPQRSFTTKNLYKVLEIESKATPDEIKKAYRAQCLKWHPDKAGNTPENNDIFNQIKEAYDILSDAEARKGYDAYRARNDPKLDHKHSSSRKSSNERHHEHSRSQRNEWHYMQEPSNSFNGGSRDNQDCWAHFRTRRSDAHNSRSVPGDRSRREAFVRRGTIRMALEKISGIGGDIQAEINHLVANHRALWADFVAYGLDRGTDADLWYDLFDATKAANRKVRDIWDDIISQAQDMWAGVMQPGSENLPWKICQLEAEVLHMVVASACLRDISYILCYNFRNSYPELRQEMIWLFKSWRDTVKR
ncbi:hypothetical protein F5X99DRAFT_426502 [Biscogniauxia marginata]|nr:hypothetical protein F5X99DRAFT_426502 [Biscogniauxia marginata]